MATLVMTTVGTLIGGPIGGAVGAILGQQVDQRLFAPRRQGPRLGELGVQTSSYGQPIPRLFGRLRVAGTVIWATDLREDRHRSGGGKGKPKTTTYSYSASFAVALSARPIRAVHRIWADGKLLRGTAGDWKSETGFRLYPGNEAQQTDPLIASAQGMGTATAHRGLAYAVFQDFQLADYGNRIPSLTFEVEADDGPVLFSTIAEDLSDGAIGGATVAALRGFAATGDSVRGAIEALARALPASITDDGACLLIADVAETPLPIAVADVGASASTRKAARFTTERAAAGTLPDEVAIAYYEPDRDYQAGLQRARRNGAARRADRIELPAALSANEAKALATRRLADIWASRSASVISLPWRHMTVRPGQDVMVGENAAMRIRRWTLDRMALEVRLAGIAGTSPPLIAEPGGGIREADMPHGPTALALFELPSIGDAPETAPAVFAAAAGPSGAWRRAVVSYSRDGGARWSDGEFTGTPATMGTARTILPVGDGTLIDGRSWVEVELLNDSMALTSCDDMALVNGANPALLGGELIQFGSAEPLGSNRFRLFRLLRGRRGSEAAASGHVVGESFVLLEAANLLRIDLPMTAIGASIQVMASGIGDEEPVFASRPITGMALLPPSPVHIGMRSLDNGDIIVQWTRRSRAGWNWLDGGEAPLVEESERYRVEIRPSIGFSRAIDVDGPSAIYTATQRAADNASDADLITFSVRQYGVAGLSRPLTGQLLL